MQRVGDFEILGILGEGSMGRVYRALQPGLRREVALKVLRRDQQASEEIAGRFRRESRILVSLDHPNLVRVFDAVFDGDPAYIAMELVDGPTLRGVLTRGGPLDTEQALSWFSQLVDAIQHLHRQGVVHRDLKPANIMMAGGGILKVIDFGLARGAGDTVLTHAEGLLGTPAYFAPEIVGGATASTPADVYALGLIAHELFAGGLPYRGESVSGWMDVIRDVIPPRLSSRRDGIDPDLDDLVDSLLSKDPGRRPDMDTLAGALERIRYGPEPVGAGPEVGEPGTGPGPGSRPEPGSGPEPRRRSSGRSRIAPTAEPPRRGLDPARGASTPVRAAPAGTSPGAPSRRRPGPAAMAAAAALVLAPVAIMGLVLIGRGTGGHPASGTPDDAGPSTRLPASVVALGRELCDALAPGPGRVRILCALSAGWRHRCLGILASLPGRPFGEHDQGMVLLCPPPAELAAVRLVGWWPPATGFRINRVESRLGPEGSIPLERLRPGVNFVTWSGPRGTDPDVEVRLEWRRIPCDLGGPHRPDLPADHRAALDDVRTIWAAGRIESALEQCRVLVEASGGDPQARELLGDILVISVLERQKMAEALGSESAEFVGAFLDHSRGAGPFNRPTEAVLAEGMTQLQAVMEARPDATRAFSRLAQAVGLLGDHRQAAWALLYPAARDPGDYLVHQEAYKLSEAPDHLRYLKGEPALLRQLDRMQRAALALLPSTDLDPDLVAKETHYSRSALDALDRILRSSQRPGHPAGADTW